jgi:3-methyladenine DNA glycosylase/8-oxoguanine DNA glycosylase
MARPPAPTDVGARLAALDPVLAQLVARYGPPRRRRATPGPARFGALCRMIVFQQLAGRAATVIHGRFVDALDGEVTAARVLAAEPVVLAGCGLSANKAAAIRDLAEHVCDGRVRLEGIGRRTDHDIESHLVQVRGIGPWTAQLFLLAVLGRPDVWPTGDWGVRVGFARAWGLSEVPTPRALLDLGEPFRPYRSAVAGYCWTVADEPAAV